jgi:hypothetical protein
MYGKPTYYELLYSVLEYEIAVFVIHGENDDNIQGKGSLNPFKDLIVNMETGKNMKIKHYRIAKVDVTEMRVE